MFGDPRKIRVQHSDVKEPGNRWWILGGKIRGNLRSGKTLAMYCTRNSSFVKVCGSLARKIWTLLGGRSCLISLLAAS